ncbi:TraM recognition domain-containing protein [Paludisphaera sp.]|uniref:type IV secretory system conjugative DNA transfer family protein n=1 Tax=Paludisphaera sp. TaxID=2017432 RepID=UPI00301BE95D
MTPGVMVAVVLTVLMSYVCSRISKRRRKGSKHPLSSVIFHWPDKTPFRVSDMLRSVEVKGITGGGKSSGPGEFFARKLAAHPKATMLIIAQKPEERDDFIRIFRKAGREKDLLIVEESSAPLTCNFLQVLVKAGTDTRGIVEFLMTMVEVLEAEDGGNQSDPFWKLSQGRLLYNAIEMITLSGEELTPEAILEFIATAAYSQALLADKAWKAKYHNTVVGKAEARSKSGRQKGDFNLAVKYWLGEFPVLDDKPRTSIIAGVMNVLHTFNTGLVREMCSGETKLSPSALEQGKSILINFPISSYGPSGRFIAGGWKYLTQKHILRRKWDPSSFFTVIVCDEFQEAVTSFDPRFLAQCRSHGGALFALTQTIHSEYGAMTGKGGNHKADSLLANFNLHLYTTVDAKTAKFASDLLGQRLEAIPDISEGEDPGIYQELMGKPRFRLSVKRSYQPVLQPAVFLSGLRNGGPENDNIVDAVVIRLGNPFLCGENYQFVSFEQPKR